MERIDGPALKQMIVNAANAIELNKQTLNELNVFPVPDGDTGTNMSLTIKAAATELNGKESADVSTVAGTVSKAMVRGARGNSGVIMSLLFRGFGKRLKDLDNLDGAIFAEAMQLGVQSAYKSVMKPAEGTILTVSRVSSDAGVLAAADNPDPEFVLDAMLKAAEAALAETIHQNPVLEKAGVVDAGAKGYVYIIDAMLKALRGQLIESSFEMPLDSGRPAASFAEFATEDIKFAYCTEFIINVENKRAPERLRALLDSIGDSLVFVEDDDIIKVHVHTNDPGKALQEGQKHGSLTKIKIENMREQHTEKIIITGMDPIRPGERIIAKAEKRYGVVAVCAGDGLSTVFRDIGADNIVEGGQTMNPSTEDILLAIDRTPSEIVMVFPNNKNIIMAAEQCIAMSGKTVMVIPTKSVPQGIAALLTFDPELEPRQNRELMNEAIGRVRTGQLTYASRDSFFDGKKIKSGDHLALLDGDLVAHGKAIPAVLKKLARDMSDKTAEFITIFYGQDVTEEDAEEVRAIFEKEFKNAEMTVLYGGQPIYSYMISVE